MLWFCVFAGLAVAALAPVAGQQPPPSPPSASTSPASAASAPGAAAQNNSNDRQAGKQSSDAVKAEEKKQPVQDSEKLLKLATSLKAEVDKTNQDTLSLSVIRQAGEIERLAHSVREKAKLSAKANQGGGS
jgi:hypothetical protein